MTELEKVKEQSYAELIQAGYTPEQAQATVDSFQAITAYYNGKPSRVRTSNGTEIFL